jgi:hypothetical protein
MRASSIRYVAADISSCNRRAKSLITVSEAWIEMSCLVAIMVLATASHRFHDAKE